VSPPDDTWVAFGPDPRGYKKHCHFKVAVSRSYVRFLFEVGPEHSDKRRWARRGGKNAPNLAPVLRRVKHLAWFKNEHDEEPRRPSRPHARDAGRARRRADADPRRAVVVGRACRPRRPRAGRSAVPLAQRSKPSARWRPSIACASWGRAAVIFDMDGVLVDSNAHTPARVARSAGRAGRGARAAGVLAV